MRPFCIPKNHCRNEVSKMSLLIYEQNAEKRRNLEHILYDLCMQAEETPSIYCVKNAREAMEHIKEKQVKAFFISLDDSRGQGYFLAKEMRERNPRLNVVVMADQPKYVQDVFHMLASGYMLGEPNREKVQYELENLRFGI